MVVAVEFLIINHHHHHPGMSLSPLENSCTMGQDFIRPHFKRMEVVIKTIEAMTLGGLLQM